MMKKICALIMVLAVIVSLAACGSPKQYTVEFNPGKGEIIRGKAIQTVNAGESAIPPKVERDGFVFAGWDDDYENINSNITISALWTAVYTVKFDPSGGVVTSGDAKQELEKGEIPVEPTVLRQDYDFLGWNEEISPATQDITYVARWAARTLSAGNVYDRVNSSMVEISLFDNNGDLFALGSGFFIDDKGTIVTNYHVMEGASSALATLYSGETYEITKIVDYSVELDLAVVICDIDTSIPLTISDRSIATGDTIYTLGSSLGITDTFSNGIVSNPSRIIDGEEFIQITAPISHGNSGGPLINAFGEAIGINSWTYTEGQNMNFAININELQKLNLSAEPMSISDFYAATYSSNVSESVNYTIVTTGDDGEEVYTLADYIEWEANDEPEDADLLINSTWTAGYVDAADIDFYGIILEEAATVTFYVYAYWSDDDEYIKGYVVDENCDLIEDLNGDLGWVTETLDEDLFYVKTMTLDPGVYYLTVFVPDDYPFTNGAYYLVAAQW